MFLSPFVCILIRKLGEGVNELVKVEFDSAADNIFQSFRTFGLGPLVLNGVKSFLNGVGVKPLIRVHILTK